MASRYIRQGSNRGIDGPVSPPNQRSSVPNVQTRNSRISVMTTGSSETETTDNESGSETKPMMKTKTNKVKIAKKRNQLYSKVAIRIHAKSILPKLSAAEQKFLEFISTGNVEGVETLLNDEGNEFTQNVDVNKTNVDGYSALQIAVQREDEAMVELLLNISDLELKDAIFLAIKEDNLQIVKMILEHEAGGLTSGNSDQSKLMAIGRCKHMKDNMENSEFEEDVTTLILSAHTGSFQMIDYFYSIGERLPLKPKYEPNIVGAEIMKIAFQRLRWYKAICNPYYISFMCNEEDRLDPILQAFNLADEMQNLANQEHDFKSDYEALVDQLREYTGDLLSLCRSTTEVQLVCSQKEGYNGPPSKIPRLHLAIQHNQVDFVVHSFAQDILHQRWVRNWDSWRTKYSVTKIGIFILYLVIAFISPLVLWCCCARTSSASWAKHFRSPLSRFLTAMASYAIFLGFLVCECVLSYNPKNTSSFPEISTLTVFHCVVVAFVCGHIISTVRQWMMTGFTQYIKSMWNVYEIINQLMFVLTFICWIWAYLEPEQKLDRKYWTKFQPLLVAESFFGIAIIMSFGRILRVFQLHSRFGPLQIALGYMLKDLGLGIFFYAITIFSFASGFCMLYKSFRDVYDETTPGGTKTHQNELFTTFRKSFQALFWGLYNLSPMSDGTTIISVHEPGNKNSSILHHPMYTEWTGKFFVKTYQVLYVLMFSNVIMAMLSNTSGAVFENKEREWRFNRAQVWIFFGRETILPSPWNIISTIVNPCLPNLVSGSESKGKEKKKKISGWSITRCCFEDEIIEEEEERKNRTEYAVLVKQLLQRYFHEKSEDGQDDYATAHQVTRIREDVVEMKEKCKGINRNLIYMLTGQNPNRRLSKMRKERKFSLDNALAPAPTGSQGFKYPPRGSV